MPTTAHLPAAWIMGFDLYPDGHAGRQEGARAGGRIERETLVFFEHDPAVAAGYLTHVDGKRRFEPAHA